MPRASNEPSGQRTQPLPPPHLDAFDGVIFLVTNHELDLDRSRRNNKHRARNAMLAIATLSGATAVIGAGTAATGLSQLGVLSALAAAAAAVVSAWDGHFQHAALWHNNSVTLTRLHTLKYSLDIRRRAGEDRDALGIEGLAHLNAILRQDNEEWAAMHAEAHTKQNDSAPQ